MKSFASSKRKNPAELPAHLRDRLISYTAAAGAALSVAAPAAQAKVVYVPTNVEVTNGYAIDIGGIRAVSFPILSTMGEEAVYASAPGGWIVTHCSSCERVVAATQTQAPAKLASGARIGPKGPFAIAKSRMDFAYPILTWPTPGSIGPWRAVGGPATGYLGFRFLVDGKPHFGWARLTFERSYDPTPLVVTLSGYAYETIEDRPIVAGDESGRTVSEIAPQPSLGMLAFGSQAVAFWRKRWDSNPC
jgi:hypothetical protein